MGGSRVEASAAGAPPAQTPPRWRRQHLTVEERVARGRSARDRVPRGRHAEWTPAAERPDPVALLEEQGATRLEELLPIRYGRMLESPFAFYRGAALLMANDLAASPCSEIQVQLCGDAHLSNFGLYASPERRLLFDINDFDETLPGPWEWDVKRLAASFEVLGRHNGFTESARNDVVLALVREYQTRMQQSADMRTLEAWYDQLDARGALKFVRDEVRLKRLSKQEGRTAKKRVAQAYARDSVRVLTRRAGAVDGELRIRSDPPLIVPIEDFIDPSSEWANPGPRIKKLLQSYRRTLGRHGHPLEEFQYVHAARKVVGVGSVGTRCYILLLVGRDDGDPLFLQVKEAEPSVLERFLTRSEFAHHGERVVSGQRLMQAATDIFLGWQQIRGLDGQTRDYYIRQLQDWKGGIEVENLEPQGATVYGRLCAATLARAHARWGDRIAVAAYLGRGEAFARAIVEFSSRYADQNAEDHAAFEHAAKSGRLVVQTGI